MTATQPTTGSSGSGATTVAGPATNGKPVVEPPVLGGPEHTDYYLLDDLLTDEQRALRQRVRSFMDREVLPIINPYWERAEFPHELVPKLAELGIAGFQIPGYGSPGMSNVTAGLVIMELARGDLSISTFAGVHSALAMMSIALLGSEEQKQRFLPPMARLEKIGAFGLTEPAHGTDVVQLETTARRDGDSYVLNGHKRWIGNATFADYTIIWARGDDGHVGGYVVEKGMPGFDPQFIAGKTALRCVQNAQIFLLANNGLSLYGNGIVTREEYIKANAAQVKAFVKASLEGWKDTVANPREAADIVSRNVKGLDADATFQEVAIVSGLVATPEARAKGLGLIDAKQMAAGVDLIAKGTDSKAFYDLTALPTPPIKP